MKKLILATLMLALAAGCASIPAKQKAVTGIQAVEAILGQAQDIERQLCNPAQAAQVPRVPITHCDGATAAAIKLDDVQHQKFAAALAKAFGLQVRAVTALQAWRSGEPVPTSLAELQVDVTDALAVVQQLVQGPQDGNVRAVILKIEAALAAITQAVAQIKGGA